MPITWQNETVRPPRDFPKTAGPWMSFQETSKNKPMIIGLECFFCQARPQLPETRGRRNMTVRMSLTGWFRRKFGGGLFGYPRSQYACPKCVKRKGIAA